MSNDNETLSNDNEDMILGEDFEDLEIVIQGYTLFRYLLCSLGNHLGFSYVLRLGTCLLSLSLPGGHRSMHMCWLLAEIEVKSLGQCAQSSWSWCLGGR